MSGRKRLVRRRAPKAERECQILAAAFEEFAANGYAATRLDDVARRANIAKGTIFLHFHDKKALFRAVLCSLIHPVHIGSEAHLQNSHCGNEILVRDLLSRLYVEVVGNKKARALLRLLIAESEKFPELAEMYYQEIIASGASTIGFVVEKGIASGEFGATDARCFPQILVAPAILAVVWILLLGKRHGLDLDAYREAHLDFVMRGLRGATPANPPKETALLRPGEPS